MAELKLKLKSASLVQVGEGKWRVTATAQLIYAPADRTAADSREFPFTAPLGPIEADDLRWYLERYYLWPTGVFTERAKHIEAQLPQWGQELYDAATAPQSARDLLADWRMTADGVERRFSIFVDDRALEGSSKEEQAAANEAASALLALPWELMHDGRGFLFQGKNPVRVRRCLPKELPEKPIASSLPIRILLLSLRRAIECKEPFGHAAEPWKTYSILHDLEQATGNAQAADAARGHAIASYLAYRRAGGESQSNQAQLLATILQAIRQGATTRAEQFFDEWSEEDDPQWVKALAARLRAILRGDRDPALAADPNLSYAAAAELQLLLEALHAK